MKDTVKIIIEIPKDIYKRCKEYKLRCGEAEILEGAVAKGAPYEMWEPIIRADKESEDKNNG